MSGNVVLTLSDGDRVIWRVKVDNIEIAAGMMAAAVPILLQINAETSQKYIMNSNPEIPSGFLIATAPQPDISVISETLPENRYGLWVMSANKYDYYLYAFRTEYWLQGFISICQHFGVDHRRYIYGHPFKVDGSLYLMSGYISTGTSLAIDPYEIDDIEDEEMDDENIIAPQQKDE